MRHGINAKPGPKLGAAERRRPGTTASAAAILCAVSAACSNQHPAQLAATQPFSEIVVPLTAAVTTSYQDGAMPFAAYAGARDTRLAQAQPAANFGAETTCRIDGNDPSGTGYDVASLLAWQITGIPAGSVVTGANLSLYVTDSSSGTWQIYALARPWSETSATWQQAETGTPWAGAGAKAAADRGKLLGTFSFTSTHRHDAALNADGVAQVQQWLDDPSSNHGVILVGPSSDGETFVSREGSSADQRPRLDVVWTGTVAPPSSNTLIAKGSSWKFLDTGVAPAAGWGTTAFTDGAWKQGPAELGYGDGDENTVVSYGASASGKRITTWFRQSFNVADPKAIASLLVSCKRDDGVVLYLNGTEILRSNMPGGTPLASTLALHSIEDENYYEAPVDPALLLTGANVLAAEVHQGAAASTDLSFDAGLEATAGGTAGGAVLLAAGSKWLFRDDGVDPGTGWQAKTYDDSGWKSGLAEMGYGDGDEKTVIGYGGSTSARYITSWFRQHFNVSAETAWTNLAVHVKRDDGVVVYLNGTEIFRNNMPAGGITAKTLAAKAIEDNTWFDAQVSPALLVAGDNVVAVEVHQAAASSSDLSMDLQLDGLQANLTDCTDKPDATGCSDANACTVGDTCVGGACVPGAVANCEDNNPCTNNICNTELGCTWPGITGGVCNDNDTCTSGDTCAAGECKGTALNCDDKNACTTDGCSATGCTHDAYVGACSDGNACTVGDECLGTVCQPGGNALGCDDSNVCTDDSCDAVAGCKHAFNTLPCSDGSTCTTGDACQAGICKPAAEVACNDLNPCTDDTCGAAGCLHTNNSAPCDDGSACTAGDSCASGACAGTAANCNDGNACTTDTCVPASGCAHAPASNGAVCSDGNGCTTADACLDGACTGGAPKFCDDDNQCTTNTCNVGTGKCVYVALANGTVCQPSGGCSSATCQANACVSTGCQGEDWPWVVPASFEPATKWFDPVRYHTVSITLSASDWTKYLNDVKSATTETWYKANAVIDGTTYTGVGIRAFGYGSMLTNPGKPNIRIKFAEFTAGTVGPEGLANVRFKASGQDRTFVREPIAYGISRALGGPAPRTSWARLTVNGTAYGPFIVTEHVDNGLFSFFWGNINGHFLESESSCVGINCPDSGCSDVLGAYDLHKATGAELVAMAQAIHSNADATWVADVAALANMPALLVFYAMDVLTSNVDGMTTAANNFDIYTESASNKMFFIHHGMDLVLGNWSAWYDWLTPWGPPCSWCDRPHDDFYYRLLKTPALKQQLWDVYKAAHCGPFSTSTVNTLVDKMRGLIGADIYNDPKGIRTKKQIDDDFEVLKTYMIERNESLDSLVGTCP